MRSCSSHLKFNTIYNKSHIHSQSTLPLPLPLSLPLFKTSFKTFTPHKSRSQTTRNSLSITTSNTYYKHKQLHPQMSLPSTTSSTNYPNKKINHSNSCKIVRKIQPLQDLNSLYNKYLNYKSINNNNKRPPLLTTYINERFVDKRLLSLYNLNKDYIIQSYKIKQNNNIALQNDFNLQQYHNMLLQFTGVNVRKEFIIKMRDKLKHINTLNTERYNHLKYNPKTRWDKLIEKVGNDLPKYIVDKIRKLNENRTKSLTKSNKQNKQPLWKRNEKCIV